MITDRTATEDMRIPATTGAPDQSPVPRIRIGTTKDVVMMAITVTAVPHATMNTTGRPHPRNRTRTTATAVPMAITRAGIGKDDARDRMTDGVAVPPETPCHAHRNVAA
jgi:hypothetical protein